jgi:hypothetical protein
MELEPISNPKRFFPDAKIFSLYTRIKYPCIGPQGGAKLKVKRCLPKIIAFLTTHLIPDKRFNLSPLPL